MIPTAAPKKKRAPRRCMRCPNRPLLSTCEHRFRKPRLETTGVPSTPNTNVTSTATTIPPIPPPIDPLLLEEERLMRETALLRDGLMQSAGPANIDEQPEEDGGTRTPSPRIDGQSQTQHMGSPGAPASDEPQQEGGGGPHTQARTVEGETQTQPPRTPSPAVQSRSPSPTPSPAMQDEPQSQRPGKEATRRVKRIQPSGVNHFHGFVEGAGRGSEEYRVYRVRELKPPITDETKATKDLERWTIDLLSRCEAISTRSGCWLYMAIQHPAARTPFVHFMSRKLRRDAPEACKLIHREVRQTMNALTRAHRRGRVELEVELEKTKDDLESAQKRAEDAERALEALKAKLAASLQGSSQATDFPQDTQPEQPVHPEE
ncbi:hypothetical protein CC1G_02079 [Coprinopsis cinerea okayama7|uniref:Uncharacterized protein n=1 Tax=Coprinopsis cinerea (strain Okayama-7 / 130 / ATCC MYA-4618 / FGSC 9003) TaxID=240176 RepID=A8NK39_COPC7|nr:hypothetical protein CC1G_02079 [Coprinopsis cinerea okayama7\|eukprot:XP_001834343.2 hypothetical protein CC1G_02079 [Coprinopsis cinerea okayama7\